ncbi:MAG: hypothetical protein V3V14_11500 [Saprospiraceae bacterium]
MSKDKSDQTTEKNLEYNSARAEKTKRSGVKDDTKKKLVKNLNSKKR